MNLILALPIKACQDPLIIESLEYLKRLKKPFIAQAQFCEPKSLKAHDSSEKRMLLEAKALLLASSSYTRIALCPRGKVLSSEEFAQFLSKKALIKPKIAFLIGGALGLHEELYAECEDRISLSAMTLPHRMAFLFLAEQIYRAQEILNRGPYHK